MSTGLRTELANLLANISRTDDLMGRQSDEFWRNGGVCCPGCGVPGYSALALKQERRQKRVVQVRAKLRRDAGETDPIEPHPAPPAPPPSPAPPPEDASLRRMSSVAWFMYEEAALHGRLRSAEALFRTRTQGMSQVERDEEYNAGEEWRAVGRRRAIENAETRAADLVRPHLECLIGSILDERVQRRAMVIAEDVCRHLSLPMVPLINILPNNVLSVRMMYREGANQ